jgi:hypothetical protein
VPVWWISGRRFRQARLDVCVSEIRRTELSDFIIGARHRADSFPERWARSSRTGINLDRSRLKGTRENYKFFPSSARLSPINNRDFLETLPPLCISADVKRKGALPAEFKRKLKRDHRTRADGRMDDGGAKCEKRRAYAIPEQAAIPKRKSQVRYPSVRA